jgi:hypothetical protein
MKRPSVQIILQGAILSVIGAGAGFLSAKAFGSGYIGGGNGYLGDFANVFFGINPENGTCYGLVPGLLFGMCVALVYGWHKKSISHESAKHIVLILWYCSFSFFIARFLATVIGMFYMIHQPNTQQETPALSGLLVVIPGFLGTYIMVRGLNAVTQAYSPKLRRYISISGGLTAALLMLLVSHPPSLTGLGETVLFFSGWQSIMLVAVGLPLLRSGDSV